MAAAARIVLRDWSIGKFTRYTTPPAPPIDAAAAQSSITAKLTNPCDNVTRLYVTDEAIFSTIQTRKEKRKQGGLVKFAYGSIDPRKVAVEEPWNGLEQNDDEESDEDEVDDGADVEGMDIDGEDEDEENEDEEDEEEDEEASDAETENSQEGEEVAEDADEDEDESEIELMPPSRKQKRKRGPERSVPSPPAKKVAFSTTPPARGTKSDRKKIEAMTKGILKEPMKITQQQKKLPKPVQVSSGAAKKSLSKPSPAAAANPVHKTSEKKGKVANVTAKIKAKGSLALAGQSKDKSESEVYDFGKFF